MEYITTRKRLDEVGSFLGKMTDVDYQTFVTVASRTLNIPNPTLVIEWTFKIDSPMGYRAGAWVAYRIVADEWQEFISDISSYCTYVPNVYVVDGAKFTTGI